MTHNGSKKSDSTKQNVAQDASEEQAAVASNAQNTHDFFEDFETYYYTGSYSSGSDEYENSPNNLEEESSSIDSEIAEDSWQGFETIGNWDHIEDNGSSYPEYASNTYAAHADEAYADEIYADNRAGSFQDGSASTVPKTTQPYASNDYVAEGIRKVVIPAIETDTEEEMALADEGTQEVKAEDAQAPEQKELETLQAKPEEQKESKDSAERSETVDISDSIETTEDAEIPEKSATPKTEATEDSSTATKKAEDTKTNEAAEEDVAETGPIKIEKTEASAQGTVPPIRRVSIEDTQSLPPIAAKLPAEPSHSIVKERDAADDASEETEPIEFVPSAENAVKDKREAEDEDSGADATQATARIYFPAGLATGATNKDGKQNGLVSSKPYIPPKPKEDEVSEDTEPIEIRRVLSQTQAMVLEQEIRALDPQAELPSETAQDKEETESTDKDAEQFNIDEASIEGADDLEDLEELEEPKPWHARLPLPKGFQLPLSLSKDKDKTKDQAGPFDAWLSLPFKPSKLPKDFAQRSSKQRRALLYLSRLEGEVRGLILTSALMYLLLKLIWLLLPSSFLGILKNQLSGHLVYQLLLAGLVLLLPLLIYAKFHPFPIGRIFGPVMPAGSQNATAALIGIPLGVLTLSLQNIFSAMIPELYSSNLRRFMYMPHSLRPGSSIMMLLLLILIPAFLEELFFRGNLFTSLYRQGHIKAAFILPSFLYAFLTKDPVVIIPFIAGIAFSFVRYLSSSLFSTMLAHLSFGVTIALLYQFFPAFVRTVPLSSSAGQASLYASIVALIVSGVTLVSLISFLGSLQSSEQASEFSNVKASRRSLLRFREIRIGVLIYVLLYLVSLSFI